MINKVGYEYRTQSRMSLRWFVSYWAEGHFVLRKIKGQVFGYVPDASQP
ncbi:protein of unknown function [Kyrpidia spormannii]|uniref:Uncharacterized protein n=1 Tax=Kyrpidia spormannii TaxID=2055160 RepID=A0ACA8ZDL1_9BACL|nr:protein of unknown function [Kyrpidia spormannii]